MPLITADRLTRVVESILAAAGADDDNARRVAHALVLSDLSGVATHGVQHVAGYVRSIRDGEVLPAAKPSVLSETDTSALVTGNWTFGFVAAKFGLDLAIDKARAQGMSTISVVQTNHIGRLGEYAEIASENDMISITWASGYGKLRPVAIPYGGSKPLLSTNPISIGAPAGDGPPMVLDYATTSIAQSKAMIAAREGRELDPGLIVDLEGRPETSPQALFDGEALLPTVRRPQGLGPNARLRGAGPAVQRIGRLCRTCARRRWHEVPGGHVHAVPRRPLPTHRGLHELHDRLPAGSARYPACRRL